MSNINIKEQLKRLEPEQKIMLTERIIAETNGLSGVLCQMKTVQIMEQFLGNAKMK